MFIHMQMRNVKKVRNIFLQKQKRALETRQFLKIANMANIDINEYK